jgi:hypothetical protein
MADIMNLRPLEQQKAELILRIDLRRRMLSSQKELIKLSWKRSASLSSQLNLPANALWWIAGPCAAYLLLARRTSASAFMSVAMSGLRLGNILNSVLRDFLRIRGETNLNSNLNSNSTSKLKSNSNSKHNSSSPARPSFLRKKRIRRQH